ncbi:hypothetical protein MegaChil _gp0002 [Megavirus chiliensis]|uniref:Uncharacterized protein mg2 n=1 Tax=Megavirus chiliensis TaxID=1094892 RepID=G5CQB3_9VIRU|nr:hypothetical protein MegaChil _gp0002 [Megavirus chiliensis]
MGNIIFMTIHFREARETYLKKSYVLKLH